MKKCPECNAPYDVHEVVCINCGAELPAPYEEIDDAGYGSATEALATPAESPEDWADLGIFSPRDAQVVAQQLATGGIRYFLYPPIETGIGGETHVMVPKAEADAAWAVLARASLKPEQITILSGAEIFLGDTTFNPGTVLLAEGRIIEVLNFAMPDPADGSTFIDVRGLYLAPGFIDLHTHGMLGIDTNKASVESFQRMSREAARFGVTAMAPTTVACSASELRWVLKEFQGAREAGFAGARLLGIHLESNFISAEFKGAQPAENIFPPDSPQGTEILRILEEYAGEVVIVTLAPEVPGGLELIGWLGEHNIIASLGHSSATYEQAVAGFDAGARHVTHLFNAMPPLHHRAPGLVGAALENDEVFVEMVCDGVHIHPAVISTTITAKGGERFIPVSDGLPGAGMTAGSFEFAGRTVSVQDGCARMPNGTIAGSIKAMDGVLRVLVDDVNWDLTEALALTSTTPADSLGLTNLGRITQGAIADLVVLDSDLQVLMTLVGGQIVYQREGSEA